MLIKDHNRQRVEANCEVLDCYAQKGEEFLDSIISYPHPTAQI